VDAFTEGFEAGSFHRWHAVTEHGSEDVDHLAPAIG